MHLFLCIGDRDLGIFSDRDVYAAKHCVSSGEVCPHSLRAGCLTQTHHPDTSANHRNMRLHPALGEVCKSGGRNDHLVVPIPHHCLQQQSI